MEGVGKVVEGRRESGGMGDAILAFMVIVLLFFLTVMAVMSLGGCATLYVAGMRSDYDGERRVTGIYGGKDVYPSCYHATWVAASEEMPGWWCPSDYEWGREYQAALWPLGAVFSIVDVGVSVVTDTVMLPLDAYRTSVVK